MLTKILVGCCVFAFAAAAYAQPAPAAKTAPAPAKPASKPAAAQMPGKTAEKMPAKTEMKGEKAAAEMPMHGPMSRKVMHEAQDKKGVDALFKELEAAFKKGDANAVAELVDFPVLMVTDNAKGEFMYTNMDKDAFIKDMSQSMQGMPKNAKMSSKHTAHFLSDSLASVDETVSMSMGKMHGSWNAAELVVNKDGKWMVKMMAEAGWGDAMNGEHAAMAPAGGGAMGQAGK